MTWSTDTTYSISPWSRILMVFLLGTISTFISFPSSHTRCGLLRFTLANDPLVAEICFERRLRNRPGDGSCSCSCKNRHLTRRRGAMSTTMGTLVTSIWWPHTQITVKVGTTFEILRQKAFKKMNLYCFINIVILFCCN